MECRNQNTECSVLLKLHCVCQTRQVSHYNDMTNKPEPEVDPLAWVVPIAREVANSLTDNQIAGLKRVFAYHHRNFVEQVSLPTNEKE